LMGRKILRDKGAALSVLIDELNEFSGLLANRGGVFDTMSRRFAAALSALESATSWYIEHYPQDPDLGSAVGVDFLMLAGNVVCGWLMVKSAIAAKNNIDEGSTDAFLNNKINTACYFCEHILPRSEALATVVQAGSMSTMGIKAEDF